MAGTAGSVAPVFHAEGYVATNIYDFYHAIIHNNKLYFCRQDGTIGHEPTGVTDEYWFLSLDGTFADAASLGGETALQWQRKINVEKARIDALIALEESSELTDVEKEVNDIKVGADGVTYGTAGTAVRTQIANVNTKMDTEIGELKSDLSELGNDLMQLGFLAESVSFAETSSTAFDVKWVEFKPQAGKYRYFLTNIQNGNYNVRLTKAKTLNGTDVVKTIVPSISNQGNRVEDFYLSEEECAEIAYIGLCAIHTKAVAYDFTLMYEPLLGLDVHDTCKSEIIRYVQSNAIEMETEQGEIGGTGVMADNTNYIRTKNYINAVGDYIVNSTTGLVIYLFSWDKETYSDMTTKVWGATANKLEITFEADRVYKFSIRKADSSAITPNECDITIEPAYPVIAHKNPNMLSIAHRGYSPNGNNHNKLSAYIKAAKRGFDYGETDLKETSDGVIVCCHDNTFVDSTTKVTVTIAEKTYAELQNHNYYGEKIATLEEVVSTCKKYGMGIVLDQLGTASIILKASEIIRKYQMEDRTIFLFGIGADNGITLLKSKIPNATIGLVGATATLDAYLEYANQIADNTENVYVALPYILGTAEEISTFMLDAKNNVKILVWTVDDMERYSSYLPYVSGIISNYICYNDYMAEIN